MNAGALSLLMYPGMVVEIIKEEMKLPFDPGYYTEKDPVLRHRGDLHCWTVDLEHRQCSIITSALDYLIHFLMGIAFIFHTLIFNCSFGFCPYMTEDNKDQFKGKDLLVAYYDVDYEKNPKGSNYWRNRYLLTASNI